MNDGCKRNCALCKNVADAITRVDSTNTNTSTEKKPDRISYASIANLINRKMQPPMCYRLWAVIDCVSCMFVTVSAENQSRYVNGKCNWARFNIPYTRLAFHHPKQGPSRTLFNSTHCSQPVWIMQPHTQKDYDNWADNFGSHTLHKTQDGTQTCCGGHVDYIHMEPMRCIRNYPLNYIQSIEPRVSSMSFITRSISQIRVQ